MKTFVSEVFHYVFQSVRAWKFFFLLIHIGQFPFPLNHFLEGLFQLILKRPEVLFLNKLSFIIKWNLRKIPQFLSPLKREL